MNKQQFLIDAGLEVQTLEFWIEQQWLVPEHTAHDVSFSDTDVARAHLIRDLKGDFGVNDEGIDVIMNMFDQMHVLRREIEEQHNDIASPTR